MKNGIDFIRSYTDQKESASALLITMVVAALLMALVGQYISHMDQVNHMVGKSREVTARNELSDSLRSLMGNTEYIKFAANKDMHRHGNGNEMLWNCLYGENDSNCISLDKGVDAQNADSQGYYFDDYRELILAPIENHPFTNVKIDTRGDQINCPFSSPYHPSCLLSGQWQGGKRVGYNLEGDSSELSPCYPFEPIVYINPDCGVDEFGARKPSCIRAENIRLAHQIIDRSEELGLCPLPGRKITRMGSYPKKPEFISVPRHALVEFQCNPGASVLGSRDAAEGELLSGDGNIECQCQFPFAPTGTRNEKGVLCERMAEHCQAGTVLTGRNQDGTPICKYTDELSPGQPVNMSFGTAGAFNGSGQLQMSCERDGWLQDLKIDCEGEATTRDEPAVGHSCLFFYGFIKLIGGRDMIPDQIPSVFYANSGEKPCHAKREYSGMGNPAGNFYDVICTSTIFALIAAASLGAGAFVKKAAGKLVSKSTTKIMGKAAAKSAIKTGAKTVAKEAAETALKQTAREGLEGVAEKAAKEAAEAALKKGMSKTAAKKLAEQAAKKSLKVAQKEAAEKAAKGAAEKAAMEAIEKAGKEAAEKAIKEGGGVVTKKLLKEAQEAALKAARKEAVDQATKRTYDAGFKQVTKVGTTIGMRKSAKEAAEKALQKQLKITVFKTAEQKSAEIAAKNIAKKAAMKQSATYAARQKAKTIAKKTAAAGAFAAPFSNLILGGLSPALFAQSLALDVGMDLAGVGCKALMKVPIVGPALWFACVLAASLSFGAWHVFVDYSCYPLDPPRINCQLNGTCYHYGREYTTQ